jgi:hypothetical protein
VIAVSKPNHPLRLAGVLAASILFFAIVGAAVLAVLYIVHDERTARVSEVLGVSADPKQSELNLPSGLVAWHKVENADEFKELIGFKPFVPADLPATTQQDATLAVSFPDDAGRRVGRVGFSSRDMDTGGITGPTVVLNEVLLPPGAAPDGVLKRITTGTGRALAATIACRGLQVDLQFYYSPAPRAGESFVNPWMTGVAQTFLDSVKRQCGG